MGMKQRIKTGMKTKWQRCSEADIPDGIRFDVPPQNQGQIVEVAYGGPTSVRTPFEDDAPYKRVLDRSDGETTYYKRSK